MLPSRQQLHEWCVGRTTSLPEILVHQLIVQQGKRTPWSTAVQMEDNKTFPAKFYCVGFGKQKLYVSCLLSTMSIHNLSILEAKKSKSNQCCKKGQFTNVFAILVISYLQDGQRLSFHSLLEASGRVAAKLVGRIGHRIGLMMEKANSQFTWGWLKMAKSQSS